MAGKEQTGSFEPKPFGRYVLLEKLAVGGMAEIYKAKTYGVDGFEKQLAIKRILPHCAADGEFIRMLVDEAKLTVLLSHANIVQVYDLGKVGDDYFISMEFINGTNLREVMTRQREHAERLPEEIVVYAMSELCKGLDYAHRKTDNQGNPLNIVHRDISPQNILISFEGEVKIVDFGIAKAAMNVSHTMAGILKGKVAYMSPEQALGKPIDHRTDIFSAGVMLYEMLTNEKLFSGETQFEVLNQIRTTRVNTLMLPDTIPGPLKGILAKALAYNIKDRYQSAGDFQLDLTKFLYSSYIDFSPRHLAALLQRLFESEIKRKEPTVLIDEKTRSVMLNQSATENVVVHGAPGEASRETKVAEKTGPGVFPRSSPGASNDTAISGIYAIQTEKQAKKKTNPAVALLGVVTVLGLIGYLGYHYYLKPRIGKQTEITKTTKPPTTTETTGEDLGSIEVTTNPPGAKVVLNGNDTGLETPARLDKLTLGEEYQLKFTKENYKEASKTVALTSQEPVKVEEKLTPLPKGAIEIVSNPSGAKIFVNEQDTGLITPIKVENLEIEKSYNVKLSVPNYGDWTGTVEVLNFDPVKLQASLTPLTPPVIQVPPPPPQVPVAVTPPPTEVIPLVTPVPPVPLETPPPPIVATTPPPPPPPVQQPQELVKGKVSVNSEPSGAKILINGSSSGRMTPATLDQFDSGKRVTIALSKKGYEDWSRTVTVEGNKTTPLYASLKKEQVETPPPPVAPTPTPPPPPVATKTPPPPPVERTPYTPPPPPPPTSTPEESIGGKPGTIAISSDPSGAEVYVNSEYKGTTPLRASVSPGTVRIAVSKEGYMRQTTSVKVGSGENKSVATIKLGGMYGEIAVNSMPPRATVIFDGDTVTKTPVTIRKVPRDKTHTIRIKLDGYRDWETSVSLSDKDSKKFDVQLEKN